MDGKIAYWLNKRTKPISTLCFSAKDDEKAEEIKRMLESNGIAYTFNRYKNFLLNVDMKMIKQNEKLLIEIYNKKFKTIIETE